jgi:hypothetical protein
LNTGPPKEQAEMLPIQLRFPVGMTEMKCRHTICEIFVDEPKDILTFKLVICIFPREEYN